MKALSRRFFERPTERVARELLGCELVRADGRRARLVEVEAYLGIGDRAAHTFGGRRTARVEPMWGPPGHAYVYFVYGMHCCFNVVTRPEGIPEAVLVRGAEPLEGMAAMRVARGRSVADRELLLGPGNFAKAMGIDRRHSGIDLLSGGEIWLERGVMVAKADVAAGPRVGVDYAGEAASWLLRFRWVRR